METIKRYYTLSEIACQHVVPPNQVTQWKKHALEGLPDLLEDKRHKKKEDHAALVSELYQQIGQLKVELDWLKKNSMRFRFSSSLHTTPQAGPQGGGS